MKQSPFRNWSRQTLDRIAIGIWPVFAVYLIALVLGATYIITHIGR